MSPSCGTNAFARRLPTGDPAHSPSRCRLMCTTSAQSLEMRFQRPLVEFSVLMKSMTGQAALRSHQADLLENLNSMSFSHSLDGAAAGDTARFLDLVVRSRIRCAALNSFLRGTSGSGSGLAGPRRTMPVNSVLGLPPRGNRCPGYSSGKHHGGSRVARHLLRRRARSSC